MEIGSSPAAPAAAPAPRTTFTSYEKTVVAILALLQFTIVLDFLIISPLGAMLLRDLHIPTHKFGVVVSVYAFSAAISGVVAAGFADRFDRKKMLMIFYVGFTAGTLLCGIAPSYGFLVMARVVTGVFGGVIGSIVMAIVTDLFPFSMRGRVMGFVQTSFAAAQVAGLPLGMLLAPRWGWHAPFLMLVAFEVVAGVFIAVKLRPIDAHLAIQRDRGAFAHLVHTLTLRRYWVPFVTTTLLATGGYMLMPFGSTFTVNNIGIALGDLWKLYLVTGFCTLIAGPLLGMLSDRVGKYVLFCLGTALTMATVLVYTHLGHTPMILVMALNSLMFVGITSRAISASALISAVPEPAARGAFMSVTAALQQAAGGVGAAVSGLIVIQNAGGSLSRYDVLGYVVCGAMLLVVVLLRSIDRAVAAKAH